MGIQTKYYTRREFLKKSAGTTGAVIISGIGTGCSSFLLRAPEGRHTYKTFSEGHIGNLKIKNRLVRSATMIAGASGGIPEDAYIKAYKELAKGGVGLIITGFMVPTKEDARFPVQVNVYDVFLIDHLFAHRRGCVVYLRSYFLTAESADRPPGTAHRTRTCR